MDSKRTIETTDRKIPVTILVSRREKKSIFCFMGTSARENHDSRSTMPAPSAYLDLKERTINFDTFHSENNVNRNPKSQRLAKRPNTYTPKQIHVYIQCYMQKDIKNYFETRKRQQNIANVMLCGKNNDQSIYNIFNIVAQFFFII